MFVLRIEQRKNTSLPRSLKRAKQRLGRRTVVEGKSKRNMLRDERLKTMQLGVFLILKLHSPVRHLDELPTSHPVHARRCS